MYFFLDYSIIVASKEGSRKKLLEGKEKGPKNKIKNKIKRGVSFLCLVLVFFATFLIFH